MRKSTVLTAAALFVVGVAVCPSPADTKGKRLSDIPVTKTTDKASPTLMRSIRAPRDAATGQAKTERPLSTVALHITASIDRTPWRPC